MHTSVSTHICADYLNQTTGTWGPNLACYKERLAPHPERISNLYFDYALLLRAVTKLKTYLKNYTFCSGDAAQDSATKRKILHLAHTAAEQPPFFDEGTMFQDPDAGYTAELKEDFRNRFRNVSRLMDCVGCDKCRLWGKLQTVGYGTALKVLFEYDENLNGENPPLRRTELVALVNTLDRVSNSLRSLGVMRAMVEEEEEAAIAASSRAAAAAPANADAAKRPEKKAAAAIPVSNYPNVGPSDDDDDEFDDLPPHHANNDNTTIWAEITAECTIIWKAYVYVLRSWVVLPGTLFKVGVVEISRLWSFWLGLPVTERSWEFKFPARDEL